MNVRDRKKLQAALGADLPPGFRLTVYDDFINYALEGRSCRVIRIVGKGRCLIVFSPEDDVFKSRWDQPAHKMLYLNKHNELVEFNPLRVHQVYNEEHGHEVSWERAISEWVEAHDGMTFKGLGWADNCSMKIKNLVTRWQRHYSGGTFKPPAEQR